MIKVLMTTDAVGGVWTYALDLCHALAGRAQFVLANMGPAPSSLQRAEARRIPNLTLLETASRLEWMPDPWEDVWRAGEWLLELERVESPDVVHLNGFAHGTLPWRAPTLMVGHSCVLSWWQAVKGEPAPVEFSTYQHAVRMGLHAADLVVAPSYAMLNALERHYGRLSRSRVIYNGRSPALYHPGRKDPYILSAGRLWDEAKNIAALERIATRLQWPVRVAGDVAFPGRPPMVGGRLQLLGQLDPVALAKQMAHASVYALPARYEPFGLSPLEAALSGCALVLGDIASLREIWDDAATLVPVDDDEAIVHAIDRLISDEDLRLRMSLRAGARAQQYTLKKLAQNYFDAYEGLGRSRLAEAPMAMNIG